MFVKKEYMVCLNSLSKFPDAVSAFPCASVIGNLWRICIGVNILRAFPSFALYLPSDS